MQLAGHQSKTTIKHSPFTMRCCDELYKNMKTQVNELTKQVFISTEIVDQGQQRYNH